MSNYYELTTPRVVKIAEKLQVVSLPPGYLDEKLGKSKVSSISENSLINIDELKIKKAWEIAFSPAKSIPMNLIMSYMTGNSLQVIPIMMTVMLLWNPLREIFTTTNKSFENLQSKENQIIIVLAKICFILCQICNMLIAVWKLYKMGLIPHAEADWIAWKLPLQFSEKLNII